MEYLGIGLVSFAIGYIIGNQRATNEMIQMFLNRAGIEQELIKKISNQNPTPTETTQTPKPPQSIVMKYSTPEELKRRRDQKTTDSFYQDLKSGNVERKSGTFSL